jgi:hypothetical protein
MNKYFRVLSPLWDLYEAILETSNLPLVFLVHRFHGQISIEKQQPWAGMLHHKGYARSMLMQRYPRRKLEEQWVLFAGMNKVFF